MAADRCAFPPATPTVGVGFKPDHLEQILADPCAPDLFEVHAENYMGAGGPAHHRLSALRERHALSVHGVCLSIGGPGGLDAAHLERFRTVVRRWQPALVSEHLAWSTHAGVFYNDLLPLPYTRATLDAVCCHIDQVQQAIGRTLLLENPATYVAFASSTLSESEFLRAVARRTGCGLLLDVSNAFVAATNHGRSVQDQLDDFPLECVGEVHLAGYAEQRDDEGAPLLIDSHDRRVSDTVWALYQGLIARMGPRPTVVEWDSALPAWPVLRAQALRAREIMVAAAPHPELRHGT